MIELKIAKLEFDLNNKIELEIAKSNWKKEVKLQNLILLYLNIKIRNFEFQNRFDLSIKIENFEIARSNFIRWFEKAN